MSHASIDNNVSRAPAPERIAAAPRLLRLLALASFVTALLVPLAVPLDVAVAQWWYADPLPGDFARAIELTEVFAHGIGVGYVLLGCFFLVPTVRAYLPRIAALAFGAGAVATLVKVFVIRERPRAALNLETLRWDASWNFHFDPLLERVTVFDATWRSFPSGHTATAVGLAIGLVLLFPRGRYFFISIAGIAIVQRVAGGAHFVSDVVCGLAIGFAWSFVCLHPLLLGALFRPMESDSEQRRVQRYEPRDAVEEMSAKDISDSPRPTGVPASEPERRAA